MIQALNLYTLDEMKELILSNTAQHTIGKLNGEMGSDILISIINYLGDSQTPTQPNVQQWVFSANCTFDNTWTTRYGIPLTYTYTESEAPKFYIEVQIFDDQTTRDTFVANGSVTDQWGNVFDSYDWRNVDYVYGGSSLFWVENEVDNKLIRIGQNTPQLNADTRYFAIRITALLNTSGATFTPNTTSPIILS